MHLTKMRESKPDGFISIELLILIVIISLLAITGLAAFFFAHAQARDRQRMADVTAIRNALQIYFTENGFYPYGQGAGEPAGISNYLDRWPIAPPADGSCTGTSNQYAYSQKANGTDYALTFCLGQRTDGLPAGIHTITSKLVQ